MNESDGIPGQDVFGHDLLWAGFDPWEIAKSLPWKAEERPLGPLHHYTTLEGMLGVIKSGAIWASDVRYMNDSSELDYAATLIADEVNSFIAHRHLTFLAGGTSEPDRRWNGLHNLYQPFIACFCEQSDLLSQWRAYSDRAGGVSLGLDLRRLDQRPGHLLLRKVVYDRDDQLQIVRVILARWAEEAERRHAEGLLTPEGFYSVALGALERALIEPHLRFKNPAFQEEQEWRLIRLLALQHEVMSAGMHAQHLRRTAADFAADSPHNYPQRLYGDAEGVQILFRPSRFGMIPYIDIPLVSSLEETSGNLPLTQVIQGPTTHPGLALESLTLFLISQGYRLTSVMTSEIPLR